MDLARIRLAMIGGGQMAEALLAGLLNAEQARPDNIFVTDPLAERRDLLKRRFGVRVGDDNQEAADWGEVILLAVKPQALDPALGGIARAAAGKLVISIAAGIPTRRLAGALPQSRLVRVMPNAPAVVGAGMSVLAPGPAAREDDLAAVRSLFEAVGRVAIVEESLMDAVTGLSGSGPAYIFLAIEALADGGVKMGLSRSVAMLLAAQTVLGAARMLLETGEHPGRLKDRVASPGGTTIAGLHKLEQGGVRTALIAAVEAATKRSRDLGS